MAYALMRARRWVRHEGHRTAWSSALTLVGLHGIAAAFAVIWFLWIRVYLNSHVRGLSLDAPDFFDDLSAGAAHGYAAGALVLFLASCSASCRRRRGVRHEFTAPLMAMTLVLPYVAYAAGRWWGALGLPSASDIDSWSSIMLVAQQPVTWPALAAVCFMVLRSVAYDPARPARRR